MHKTMCNFCGRSGRLVLEHEVLGRVCQDCYNKDMLNTIGTVGTEYRLSVLKGEINGLLDGQKIKGTLYRAIKDTLNRYQMKLVEYNTNHNGVALKYEGRYKRADVVIFVYTVIPENTVYMELLNADMTRVMIKREFKHEEDIDNGESNRKIYERA